MTVLTKIRPKEPLKTLKWVDILIVTMIMVGEFIIRSTQQFLQSLQPVTEVAKQYTETTSSYSDGAAYSSNFTLQVMLLAMALLYLVIRHYDFKQLKVRFPLVCIHLGTSIIHDCRTVRRRRNHAERRIQLLRPSTNSLYESSRNHS